MAKELPYFQFEPAEYLTKDVSFCSLAAQGMFINICAYYWQRGCELTKKQMLRRLNHEEAFNELVDEGVIQLDDEYITINFLKEQYDSLEEKKKDSSEKGKIGNLKRWNQDIYKKFKSGKISLDEALAIAKSSGGDKLAIAKTSEIRREEKREEEKREEEKKEDNTKKHLADVEHIDFKVLLDFINLKTDRKFTKINAETRKKYKARLKDGYTKDHIKSAIENSVKQKNHQENGNQYLTPEFFSRASTLDKYGTNAAELKPKSDVNTEVHNRYKTIPLGV